MDNLKPKHPRMDDEDIEVIQIGGVPNSIFRSKKMEVYVHHVFLDEDIGPPSKYRDLINALYNAGENDQFNIFINSVGGYLSTAMAINEAIRACSGTVRAIINGECHSAASMIALNCHEIAVTSAAHAMIHTASFGSGGFMHNVKHHADFSYTMIEDLLDETYSGFLTPEEMKELKTGREFWFNSKQIEKRLATRQKYLEAKRDSKAPKKRAKTVTKEETQAE